MTVSQCDHCCDLRQPTNRNAAWNDALISTTLFIIYLFVCVVIFLHFKSNIKYITLFPTKFLFFSQITFLCFVLLELSFFNLLPSPLISTLEQHSVSIVLQMDFRPKAASSLFYTFLADVMLMEFGVHFKICVANLHPDAYLCV